MKNWLIIYQQYIPKYCIIFCIFPNTKKCKGKQDSSGFYDYGARYYNPNLGRFLTIDRYAEKYYMLTPYQYAANNPIKYINVNGDSIGPTNNLTKDQMNAMTQFAATKEGNKFLSNYAKAGQQVFGQKFNKSGKFDKKGINVNYQNSGNKTESNTTKKFQNNLEINVSLSTEGFGFDDNKLLNLLKASSHESFFHVSSISKDYLDDGKLNYSNILNWAKQSYAPKHFDHWQESHNFYLNQELGSESYNNIRSVLNEVNQKYNYGFKERNIMNAIWTFKGSLLDVNSNGKVQWVKY